MKITDLLDPTFAIPIVLILLLLGPGLRYAIKAQRASDAELLNQWANENNVTIIRAERRHLFMGPLTWKYAYGIGFKIDVVGSAGERRSGWLAFVWGKGWSQVRIGSCKTDVAWEKHEINA